VETLASYRGRGGRRWRRRRCGEWGGRLRRRDRGRRRQALRELLTQEDAGTLGTGALTARRCRLCGILVLLLLHEVGRVSSLSARKGGEGGGKCGGL
jgi:hypothetical protein